MLTTNRLDYKKELEEVIYMFTTGSDIEVLHEQTAVGYNYKDVVSINGNTFSIENSHEPTDELDKKRYEKRFSKLALYTALSNFYGVKLPWGALTGIRPVKMARDIGGDFEKQFETVFGVSKKKTQIVKEIIKNQCLIYDRFGEYKSLFIGIPFCPSKCAYCSFASQIISKSKCVEEYTQALVKEILSLKGKLDKVRSVYVGGGTPVCLPDKNLKEILVAVNSVINKGIEFTVEAGRPDVITNSNLSIMKEQGVTRICETLKLFPIPL